MVASNSGQLLASKKVRILFVNHVSLMKYGGAERVLDAVVRNLDGSRYEAVLLLHKEKHAPPPVGWESANVVATEYFDFGTLSPANRALGLLRAAVNLLKSPWLLGRVISVHDIDLVCANTLISAIYIALPAKLCGKKLIYYEHNIARQRKGSLIGVALRPLARLADAIVCISDSVSSSLVAEGISAEKLHRVYNGYDFSRLDAGHHWPSAGRDGPGNTIRIGMVANFIPWKRHGLFIEFVDHLARQLPGSVVEGVLVGAPLPGCDAYYRQIADCVENYAGSASFKLMGFQDDVAKCMSSFDVLVNPALEEPFGLIFLEAMYLRCLVVGSCYGAAVEIIAHDVTGLLVDFDALAEAATVVGQVLNDAGKMRRLVDAAHRDVVHRFSVDQQVAQLQQVFEGVAAR